MEPNTIIAWGAVDAEGFTINPGSKNWTSSKRGTGVYQVSVNSGPNPAYVLAVASGYRITRSASENDASQDNTYSTRSIEGGVFEVYSYDTGGSSKGSPQDAAFSFIAIWG